LRLQRLVMKRLAEYGWTTLSDVSTIMYVHPLGIPEHTNLSNDIRYSLFKNVDTEEVIQEFGFLKE